jgi:(1->4)-alpha-D-glucan 1-alpha-D-glucosylmutase
VPDTYQGTDLWDFSLVDPDNRRPIDYETRTEMLRQMQSTRDFATLAPEAMRKMEDGRVKLLVSTESLRFRRDHRELMHRGDYVPLTAEGPQARHVFAFARVHGSEAAIVVVPRLVAEIAGIAASPMCRSVWTSTMLHLPSYLVGVSVRHLFTGARHTLAARMPLAEILSAFPVAVLVTGERE